MLHSRFTTFLLCIFMLVGCAKNELTESEKLMPPDQPALAEAEAEAAQAIAEVEEDYRNPPVYPGISSRATITVPANSTNALQNAIQQAGVGGTVIVASGTHYESGTVTVSQPAVKVIGQPGAVIYFDVLEQQGNSLFDPVTNNLDPALYILKSNFVRIEGLTILPQKQTGSVGIYVENSQYVRLQKNKLQNFQFAVLVTGNSTNAGIYDNRIETAVTSGDRSGLVIDDGKWAKIKGNYIAGFTWDMFLSSSDCQVMDNELTKSVVGMLFCTFQGNIRLPNGDMLDKALSATKWKAIQNDAHGNFINYLLIDGANDNFLFRNDASNAGLLDVIFQGPVILGSGELALPASNNFVVNPSTSITYQDCGVNNTTLAGTKVPCP